MPLTDKSVEQAEAELAEARGQLLGTIGILAERMEPKKIASDLWESAKVKGADLAEDAVDAVRERPGLVTGAVAALALFFAREPIKDGIVHLYDKVTGEGHDESIDDNPKPEPKKRSIRKQAKPRTAKKKVEKKS